MRYYLFTVQHNMEKNAENRSAPRGFDNRNSAIAAYHAQIANDMNNQTLDWSINMIINSAMGVEMSEKFEREYIPESEPETAESVNE